MRNGKIACTREKEEILSRMSSVIKILDNACEKWVSLLPEYRESLDAYYSEERIESLQIPNARISSRSLPRDMLSEDVISNLFTEQRVLALNLIKAAVTALE